jgi:hypothetical protein
MRVATFHCVRVATLDNRPFKMVDTIDLHQPGAYVAFTCRSVSPHPRSRCGVCLEGSVSVFDNHRCEASSHCVKDYCEFMPPRPTSLLPLFETLLHYSDYMVLRARTTNMEKSLCCSFLLRKSSLNAIWPLAMTNKKLVERGGGDVVTECASVFQRIYFDRQVQRRHDSTLRARTRTGRDAHPKA